MTKRRRGTRHSSRRDISVATILIVGLFFLWGVANSLNDVLIPQFRKAFQLDDFASSLVQFAAFYFGYSVRDPRVAVHAAFRLSRRRAHGPRPLRRGRPAVPPGGAGSASTTAFLVALYVIASGLAFLETSANPLIAVMGPAGSADQRLNFAQTFNPSARWPASRRRMLIFSDVHYTPEQFAR